MDFSVETLQKICGISIPSWPLGWVHMWWKFSTVDLAANPRQNPRVPCRYVLCCIHPSYTESGEIRDKSPTEWGCWRLENSQHAHISTWKTLQHVDEICLIKKRHLKFILLCFFFLLYIIYYYGRIFTSNPTVGLMTQTHRSLWYCELGHWPYYSKKDWRI